MFEDRPNYAHLRSLFLHELEQRYGEDQSVNGDLLEWLSLVNHGTQARDFVMLPKATKDSAWRQPLWVRGMRQRGTDRRKL